MNANFVAEINRAQNPPIVIDLNGNVSSADTPSTNNVSTRESRSLFVLPPTKKNKTESSQKRRRSSSFDCISSAREKKLMDESLARFLFASNFPLDTVVSKHFHKLLNLFRPAYRIPSKEDMVQLIHAPHRDMDQTKLPLPKSQGV